LPSRQVDRACGYEWICVCSIKCRSQAVAGRSHATITDSTGSPKTFSDHAATSYGSALMPLARRRTGVKNGCGTARDVVVFLVRLRPRISLVAGSRLPEGLFIVASSTAGQILPLAPGSPGYHLAR
jgi:hypothetical protein